MIEETVAALRGILAVEHGFCIARLYPERHLEAEQLLTELLGHHTFDPNPVGPVEDDAEVTEAVLRLRSRSRLRPLFKVELREHPKFGTYARAFLGSNINTGLACTTVWLLKQVEGAWKVTTTLSPCECDGLGVVNGKKHGECKGYGWVYNRKGEEPCRPAGKLLAVERLLEPAEPDRPAYYAD